MSKLTVKYQEDEGAWKNDKLALQQQIQELYIQLDKVKREANAQINSLKTKYSDYKQKVKSANVQINTLTARLAQFEVAGKHTRGASEVPIEQSP